MKALTWVAIVSFVGLVLSILAYSVDPLPSRWDASSWASASLWLSVALLGIGLVCFVGFLIAGLISVLNWGADRPPERN